MTTAQKKKLAREARKLAMECVAGTAPPFGVGYFGTLQRPVCALGHMRARACLKDLGYVYLEHEQLITLIEEANDLPNDAAGRHAALPWPLLALADALEAA